MDESYHERFSWETVRRPRHDEHQTRQRQKHPRVRRHSQTRHQILFTFCEKFERDLDFFVREVDGRTRRSRVIQIVDQFVQSVLGLRVQDEDVNDQLDDRHDRRHPEHAQNPRPNDERVERKRRTTEMRRRIQCGHWTRQVLDPIGLAIVFVNVTCFAAIQTTFFWFVGSKRVDTIVDAKVRTIVSIAERIPDLKNQLRTITEDQEYMDALEQKSIETRAHRESYNEKLLFDYTLPPFIAFASLVAACVIAAICVKRKCGAVDLALLLTVFAAFTTELILFFAVISPSELLSDADMMLAFIRSNQDGCRSKFMVCPNGALMCVCV